MKKKTLESIFKTDGAGLIDTDVWLEPYRQDLKNRHAVLQSKLQEIIDSNKSLQNFANAYTYFGFNLGTSGGQKGIWYREWAPKALGLSLIGDFNNWDPQTHKLTKDSKGVWSVFLPEDTLGTESKVKVQVAHNKGNVDKIPAYIKQVIFDEYSKSFVGLYQAETKHKFLPAPTLKNGLKIYETHVGIAQEEAKVGTFEEFTDQVLPRIKNLGYNAIQIMGIAQHPYYGSFGYQVSNFFAVSHYFGSPKDLIRLIDTAHKMDLLVFMDVVHSHFVKNTYDGINEFDGTDYQYSPPGNSGNHPAWDTKLFDYGKLEVLQFLLSNLKFWIDEYNFDGFRFDGVTSMLYHDHGLNRDFDHYDNYFDGNVNLDALVYLQLANLMLHQSKPEVITIAEDVSGMPGVTSAVSDGGIGFDYRLAMGIPDSWIATLKHKNDESWSMKGLFTRMLERRNQEKYVAYAESHDQALVGDKTIAFRLMDKEMYDQMSKDSQSPLVDRGIALHKLIRLLTFSLGGEAWLNFMGNEFGHPEWIDFPREGNGFSHYYARRQWSLVDNPKLRYMGLHEFDKAMQGLDTSFSLLNDTFIEYIGSHEQRKLLVYRRGPLVFVFNFHPSDSYSDLRVGVPDLKDYSIVLNSDSTTFGGFGRVSEDQKYIVEKIAEHNRQQSIQIYLPCRTALVLAPTK